MTDIKYWLWLTLKHGISSSKITTLLECFSTPLEIYGAERAALSETPELTPEDVDELADKSMEPVQAVIAVCRRKDIKILTYDNPMYPQLLMNIYDPPYVLYVRCRERLDLNEYLTIAVLGTRHASRYGIETAEQLACDLAKEGALVITGMARGVDGAANCGALRAGAKTIAVLGCGADVCYPSEHEELMQAIINNGMVISEYPPGMPPLAQNFPVRNRIITGLSYGTLVVEAPHSSGALISADRALEQNREVFAVPADITRKSAEGSNGLIADGIKPVFCAEDVLCEFREQWGELLENQKPQGVNAPVIQMPVAAEQAPSDGGAKQDNSQKKQHKNKEKTNQEQPQTQQTAPKEADLPKREPEEVLEARRAALAAGEIPLSERERIVLKLLTKEPQHVDQLIHEKLSMSDLLAGLTMLEMKGLVHALPGRYYCLAL